MMEDNQNKDEQQKNQNNPNLNIYGGNVQFNNGNGNFYNNGNNNQKPDDKPKYSIVTKLTVVEKILNIFGCASILEIVNFFYKSLKKMIEIKNTSSIFDLSNSQIMTNNFIKEEILVCFLIIYIVFWASIRGMVKYENAKPLFSGFGICGVDHKLSVFHIHDLRCPICGGKAKFEYIKSNGKKIPVIRCKRNHDHVKIFDITSLKHYDDKSKNKKNK